MITLWTGASLLPGEIERAGELFSLQKDWGVVIYVDKCLMGGCKEEEARLFSVVHTVKGQEAMSTSSNTAEQKKTCLYCEGDQTGKQVAQKGPSVKT